MENPNGGELPSSRGVLACWDWAQSVGGFLKWWYPTTMDFPTKNDDFGVFWGYHHLRKHPVRFVFVLIVVIHKHGDGWQLGTSLN